MDSFAGTPVEFSPSDFAARPPCCWPKDHPYDSAPSPHSAQPSPGLGQTFVKPPNKTYSVPGANRTYNVPNKTYRVQTPNRTYPVQHQSHRSGDGTNDEESSEMVNCSSFSYSNVLPSRKKDSLNSPHGPSFYGAPTSSPIPQEEHSSLHIEDQSINVFILHDQLQALLDVLKDKQKWQKLQLLEQGHDMPKRARSPGWDPIRTSTPVDRSFDIENCDCSGSFPSDPFGNYLGYIDLLKLKRAALETLDRKLERQKKMISCYRERMGSGYEGDISQDVTPLPSAQEVPFEGWYTPQIMRGETPSLASQKTPYRPHVAQQVPFEERYTPQIMGAGTPSFPSDQSYAITSPHAPQEVPFEGRFTPQIMGAKTASLPLSAQSFPSSYDVNFPHVAKQVPFQGRFTPQVMGARTVPRPSSGQRVPVPPQPVPRSPPLPCPENQDQPPALPRQRGKRTQKRKMIPANLRQNLFGPPNKHRCKTCCDKPLVQKKPWIP